MESAGEHAAKVYTIAIHLLFKFNTLNHYHF